MSIAQEKRGVSRFDCRVSCTIYYFLGSREAQSQGATMLNISPRGAMLRCDAPLPLEAAVLLTMTEPKPISLGAQVVRVVALSEGGCLLGVRAIEDWPYSTFAELFFRQERINREVEQDELFH